MWPNRSGCSCCVVFLGLQVHWSTSDFVWDRSWSLRWTRVLGTRASWSSSIFVGGCLDHVNDCLRLPIGVWRLIDVLRSTTSGASKCWCFSSVVDLSHFVFSVVVTFIVWFSWQIFMKNTPLLRLWGDTCRFGLLEGLHNHLPVQNSQSLPVDALSFVSPYLSIVVVTIGMYFHRFVGPLPVERYKMLLRVWSVELWVH